MDEKNTEISQYNEAQLQIMRLNELWLKAEYYAKKGMLSQWKFVLDAIYRELHADVRRKDNSKGIEQEDQLLRRKIAMSKIKYQIYINLNLRHYFLKELQDTCGKGGRYMDVDTESFD